MATAGKTISCRAAVLWEPKKLCIETVEVAPPKAGEIRIRIMHTGVCHSDAFILDGVDVLGGNKYPCILGHEGSGVVESIGPEVKSVVPGDHVIPLYSPQCYECAICKHPKANYCKKIQNTQDAGVMPDGTARFTCKGKTVYHFLGCSTFSEYTVVPEIAVAKINPSAPLEKVCLIGCAIATGYGSAVNIGQVTSGSTCAVWGLGAVGMAAVMGCKAAGAKRIIGVDVNPDKFNETARRLGCTDFVNPKDHKKPIEEVIRDMTDGGVDFAFECVGNTLTQEAVLEAVKPGYGVATSVGLTGNDTKVSFSSLNLIMGKTWTGGLFGGYKGRDAVPLLVEDYLKGRIMVDEFISFVLPLEKINTAFDYMRTGKSVRSVINMTA